MDASIKRLGEKIKRFARLLGEPDIFTATLVVLVAFLSFGLGRLSMLESQKPEIQIGSVASQLPAYRTQNTASGAIAGGSATISDTTKGQYVASKNGTKYYLPWCSGADRIKEENKVWFETKEAAQKAGYTPSSTCKGL